MNALIAKLKEQPDNPLLNILSILKNPIIGILDQSEVEFILQKYEKINSNDYKKDLIDYLEDVQEIDLELIFKHPVLIYLFLVKIPCWCFYYTDVKTLFRDAINGDLDSICKLIRLDRTIMHHPDIIMHINEVSENRESDEFKKIIDAFTGKLPLPSRMDFKIDIARFIKDYVEASKSKISYQELLEIMLTQAGKLKGRSDPDLSGYTEEGTFAKTIRRKGKIIKKSNVKDKK